MFVYDEEKAFAVTPVEENGESKTVFLIGDSIRMGYCEITKKALEGVADVIYPEENCRYTQYTYVNISVWKNMFADTNKVDLVYWNNGHWDIAHWDGETPLNSTDEYCKMLCRIYLRLKSVFKNAKIVFASTMPMNPNGTNSPNPRTTEQISLYNNEAEKALFGSGCYFHDVFKRFENLSEDYYKDYCHLTDEGNKLLGKCVADYIKNLLEN